MKLFSLIAVCFAFISLCYSEDPKQVELPGKPSLGQFTLHISKTIAESEPEKNVIISPPSIYGALLLALLGSAGDTQNELAKALHLEPYLSKNDLASAYKDLGQLLSKAQKDVKEAKVFLGDAVFVNDKVKLNEKYTQEAKEYFNSEVQAINFDDEKKTTEILNEWVSKSTNGQISKFSDEPVDKQTVALLNSVLHFEAEWESKFIPDMTKKGIFYAAGGKEIEVEYMQYLKTVPFHYSDRYASVGIPYKDREAYFYIILPHKNHTVSSLLKTLTYQDYIAIVKESHNHYVDYTIPKLKLQYSKDLKDILHSFGIVKAFDSKSADFSHLASGGTYIDRVIHKAQLSVNESGTVASALTTIGMFPTSLPAQITVNRPHLFLLYQAKTGVALFTGTVQNPLEL